MSLLHHTEYDHQYNEPNYGYELSVERYARTGLEDVTVTLEIFTEYCGDENETRVHLPLATAEEFANAILAAVAKQKEGKL